MMHCPHCQGRIRRDSSKVVGGTRIAYPQCAECKRRLSPMVVTTAKKPRGKFLNERQPA